MGVLPSPLEEQSEEVGRLQVSWLSWVVKTSHRMRGRCRKMRGMTQLSRPVTPKAESREGGAAAHGPLHRGEEGGRTASGEGWGKTTSCRAERG